MSKILLQQFGGRGTSFVQRALSKQAVGCSANFVQNYHACSPNLGKKEDSIVYVNGEYLVARDAKVSVFDRGFLFSDSVYEVSAVIGGSLVDNEAHLNRLQRSLSQLSIELPKTLAEIESVQQELVRRNHLSEGLVYVQVTRGGTVADRNFLFPSAAEARLPQTFVSFVQHKNLLSTPAADRGLSVATQPDIRWKRCDIKTTGLLAQVLAKEAARQCNADDAWMVDEHGYITEGASSNAFIVTSRQNTKVLQTRSLSTRILSGITRRVVLDVAIEEDILVEERPFTVQEALDADEAFVTSASTFLLPVVKIDNQIIKNGKPGPVSLLLRQRYVDRALGIVTQKS